MQCNIVSIQKSFNFNICINKMGLCEEPLTTSNICNNNKSIDHLCVDFFNIVD